jgi:hypothetical protein
MNKLNKLAVVAGALALVGAASAQTIYNNEAAFLAAVVGPSYLEDFNNFTFGNPLNGTQTLWSAPGANGYGWDASAAGGLYSNPGAMSTNQAGDPLIFTTTGAPITAIGGRFANSDITGAIIPGTITIHVDGAEYVFEARPGEVFWGITQAAPISVIDFKADDPGVNSWVQVDHYRVGAAVPEPATVLAILAGLGVLAARRRK